MDLNFDKPIGILGGTFDPIHCGHLHIASSILQNTPIERIGFLPCYQPVHRCPPEASNLERIAMIKLALAPHVDFFLDEREILRKEPSFMIDTLIQLREDQPRTPFGLIMGADAYSNIITWKKWQQLLEFTHFIIVNRPSTPFKKHPNAWLQEKETDQVEILSKQLAGSIIFVELTPSPISATLIRQRIKSQQPITDLVPKEVAEYIKVHHLYGMGK